MPLDKPLRRGSKIKGPDGEVVWVAFKYERLINFCFRCGVLGHESKICKKPIGTDEQENQYGEWLKAGYRRMEEKSRNMNQSHPRGRGKAPTQQEQSETDRNINVTSENHGITQEINALNVPSIKVATVMHGNLKPSIPDSSPMHLDVNMDKGGKQRHYKKMLLRPRFKNAAIGPKNAA